MNFNNLFDTYKEENLFGRYVTNKHIEPLLKKLNTDFEVSVSGKSVMEKPIYTIKVGTGKFKIYMWSQMHGNEATTTKALFDFFNLLNSDSELATDLKKSFTFLCIPILNPDGAEAYTRVNANEVDLNRDSLDLTQSESKLLRKIFEEFQPDFCFNLHDQRTIFAAGNTNNPATVSFLAPSYNEEREINEVRQKAINVIAAMNTDLQKHIPNQVGRFDDSFNINCIGDMFQSLGVPTILFEAGHFQDDYQRETTRKMIFISYLSALRAVSENRILDNKTLDYFNIPQNKSIFYDFLYKNVKVILDNAEKSITFAAHYNEILLNETIAFKATIRQIDGLEDNFGHYTYDFQNQLFENQVGVLPQVDSEANFIIGMHNKIVNGLLKK
ncbi:putative carboxypeptidase [Flavobacterium limnosediminis JC2902]|uniref:Putative carboxypeptidase n=1 Tax=Flavobacterium limnosediminis JC2902 TaxID=1341181 RepID=V6SKQ4_9FLAO|nr:M14 metallopeptidase family protein [Flavobacterium limnosediminis]ESU27161.1 putative carboxypeptidase [Flavobacterium limnosediminis JC2902]